MLKISGVQATCGSNTIKTEMFKAEGFDGKTGKHIFTTLDETIPSKNE